MNNSINSNIINLKADIHYLQKNLDMYLNKFMTFNAEHISDKNVYRVIINNILVFDNSHEIHLSIYDEYNEIIGLIEDTKKELRNKRIELALLSFY